MNIHCAVTSTILLLVASLVTAQRGWESFFGYRPGDYDVPYVEFPLIDVPVVDIPPPRIIRIIDDDFRQLSRRLNFFQPFEPLPPQPVIHLPRIRFEPEVYVEEAYPYPYPHHYRHSRFDELATPPLLRRLLNTLSVTYTMKVLPVRDIADKDTVNGSPPSASNTVPQGIQGNESKATNNSGTQKDTTGGTNVGATGGTIGGATGGTNVGTIGGTSGGTISGTAGDSQTKTVTPTIKAESATNPDPVKKPESDKATGTVPNQDASKVSENKVDSVVTKPAGQAVTATEPKPNPQSGSTTTEGVAVSGDVKPIQKSDDANTAANVPAV